MNKATRLMAGVIVAGGLLVGPAPALADPREGGTASCMGYEAADVSPPGSTSGASNQFGMSGVMNIGIQGAVDAGLIPNRGALIKVIAHNKLGSHEACDEAIGLDPETE